MRKRTRRLLAFLFIAAFSGELLLSVRQLSQTWDESTHIAAGFQYWQDRDFGANPEHPPLVKLVAALPLLPLHLRYPIAPREDSKLSTILRGVEFLYGNDADRVLFRARAAASIFAVVLAALVLACGYEMLGARAALLALILLIFEPNILAHGALVTTDAGETCFFFAAIYFFYRYVKRPTVPGLLICGGSVALALAAKHSGLLLVPLLILLAVCELRSRQTAAPEQDAKEAPEDFRRKSVHLNLAIAAILAIGYVGLWAFYTFRFEARPPGEVMAPPLDAFARTLQDRVAAFSVLLMDKTRLLPEAYLWGLTDVLRGTEGRPMFLFGQVYPVGQWFYFPAVLAVKSTLGMLLLLLMLPFVKRVGGLSLRRNLLFLTIPPVFYLAISMTSGMNIGIRHILPIFPFLILLAAAGADEIITRWRMGGYLIAAIVVWHAASSLRAYPNYLAYSNELAGGPSRTYRLLSDANVDWGQGLKQTAQYLAARNISDCWLASPIPQVDPGYNQIPCRPLPTGFGCSRELCPPVLPRSIQGTVLLSATEAQGSSWGPGELNPYRTFFDRPPDALIANSILVFYGSFDLPLASAVTHAALARRLLGEKHLDEALAEFQTAVQLAPDSAEMQAHLCQALLQMNRKTEAGSTCMTALTLAQRFYPEYQFRHSFVIRELANMK